MGETQTEHIMRLLLEQAEQRIREQNERFFGTYYGLRIRWSDLLVERVQYSRSPARAKRRAAKGHRQHFVTRPISSFFQFGDMLIAHPAMKTVLRQNGVFIGGVDA